MEISVAARQAPARVRRAARDERAGHAATTTERIAAGG